MKSLKLELELKTHSDSPTHETKLPLGKMFLSKVTGLTALRRMPDLVFEVMALFEEAECKLEAKMLFALAIFRAFARYLVYLEGPHLGNSNYF